MQPLPVGHPIEAIVTIDGEPERVKGAITDNSHVGYNGTLHGWYDIVDAKGITRSVRADSIVRSAIPDDRL
jgi:hypothetical protein